MTNVFHVHMNRNAVMRTEFDEEVAALKKSMAAAVVLAEKSTKRADQAKNAADDAKNELKKKTKANG